MTSLLTLTCILKDFGYNQYNTLCIAKALRPIHEEISDIFKMSKSKKDQTLFVEAILYGLSLESIQLKQLYENSYNKTIKRKADSEENLNSRQLKIIEHLQENKKITRNECTKIMGVSFMTSYRDLTELLQAGYLEKKGKNKKTYYILKEKEDN